MLRRRACASLALLLTAACAAAPQAAPPAPPSAPVCPTPSTLAPVPAPVDPTGTWEIRWDRGFSGWQPTIFSGRLSIAKEGDHFTAALSFEQSSAQSALQSLRVDGNAIHAVFRSAQSGPDELEIDARVREDRLVGEVRFGPITWTPMGGRRVVLPELKPGAVTHSLPTGTTDGVAKPAALEKLIERAREERSSALVVVKDGRIVLERYREGYDGGPLVAMSASKSIVSLAIGLLIADRTLTLDTRMDALLPAWRKRGARSAITVRQLLTHTSGLDPDRAAFDHESIEEHALATKLVYPPGTRFRYDNGAVDFLAVVARVASGMPLDELVERRIFRKLDVVGAQWMKDKAGDPRGAGELVIRPVDLAKIGQLLVQGGSWERNEIVPAAWIAQSTAAGQPFDARCGMLWWREGSFSLVVNEPTLAEWRDAGVDARTVQAAARTLRGQTYLGPAEYDEAITSALGVDAKMEVDTRVENGNHVPWSGAVAEGPARGFSAQGWLGQYLVVYPQWHVVAVRMREPEQADYANQKVERYAYRQFAEDVAQAFGD